MKLKSYVCNMKDKVHPLDKVGAVYRANCKKHNSNYVGETDKALKERGYEHKLVTHKESTESHSIKKIMIDDHNTAVNARRSTRNTTRRDYKRMHTGADIHITEGQSEVSKHVATQEHEEGDMTIEAICYDMNWYNRGIREAIEIRRYKPDLNIDEGRHYLSPIYDGIIQRPRVKILRPPVERSNQI